MTVWNRARRLAGTASAVRMLARLSDDERRALASIARWGAAENAGARSAEGIDPSALISPLASLRFTERVVIGPRASIGPYCCVWGGWSTSWARVGEAALLGPGAVLVAGNHRIDGPGAIRDAGFEELDVEVGPGAWVGAHAVIVGCRVGTGAVVGANAAVLDDVPDGAIVAGIPARVVGRRSSFDTTEVGGQ